MIQTQGALDHRRSGAGRRGSLPPLVLPDSAAVAFEGKSTCSSAFGPSGRFLISAACCFL